MMEVRSVSDILVVGSEGKRLLWIQTNKEGTDRQNEAWRSIRVAGARTGFSWCTSWTSRWFLWKR